MKITIKRRGTHEAILISFSTNNNRFSSSSERTKFFEELYGRRQIIKRERRVYEYNREGALPRSHIKVDNSVFIIAMKHMQEMMNFFDEWKNKVQVKSFPVLLDDQDAEELEKDVEIE